MVEVISERMPIARKEHYCDACEWLNNTSIINGGEMTFGEYRQYIKAQRNKFKIVKGEKYLSQTNKFDGDIYTFKAIPEIHNICLKYNLYEV